MRKIDLVLIFLLLIVVGSVFYVYMVIKSDGYKCINNPLVYGAKKAAEVNDAEFSCSCIVDKPGMPTVEFNTTGLYTRRKESNPIQEQINFSEFEGFIPDN